MKSVILKGFLPTILKNKFQDIEVIYDFVENHIENSPEKITIIDVFCDRVVLTDFLSEHKLNHIKKEVESQLFGNKPKPKHYQKSTLADFI